MLVASVYDGGTPTRMDGSALNKVERHFQAAHQPGVRVARLAWACVISIAAVCSVAFEHGYHEPLLSPLALGFVQALLPWFALVIVRDVRPRRFGKARWRNIIGVLGELLVVGGVIAAVVDAPALPEVVAVMSALSFAIRLNGALARSVRNPMVLFPASFLLLMTVATCLLKLPAATPHDQPIGWIDAMFTSTSAVCVTGLAVRDTATGFTPFGQAVVLGAIQLGGLGVTIFGSTLALLFRARLSHRENVTLSMALDEYPAHKIARFASFIVLTTLVLEAIGAGILWFTWPDGDLVGGDRVWASVFHSVSAFCNAGFDITGQSMIGVRSSVAAYLGIIPMIIMGGLGFIVLEDVFRWGTHRLRPRRDGEPERTQLSTHTKLVLVTTAVLLVGGALVILAAQVVATDRITGQSLLDATFMSTTARTAGFTSVPMEELSPSSRFALVVLMSVGGSPGSTAGGMKTTVVAMLVLATVATVRGRDEVEVFGRALPDALVKKAATIVAGFFGIIGLATFALDMTEDIAFEPLLFEVVSAATTTGLSLGATTELGPMGRIVIAATMFLGRVGALSLVASLVGMQSGAGQRYQLPRDSVSLG